MELTNATAKAVYYCYVNSIRGGHLRRRESFNQLEAAQREAAMLQYTGYQGMIVRTYEPFYDDEKHSFHDFEIIEQF
jgi:hypothetical protein